MAGSDAPIIGILSQETYILEGTLPGEHHDSFIAASNVKYLESAGAMAIPVWTGQNEEYYRRVVNYTNGLIFPGGGTYFNETNGYAEAAKILYKLAVEANNKGIYYPVWGICLGMQVLAFAAKGEDIRENCYLDKVAIPLNFTEGHEKSKLFAKTPEDILQYLKTRNVTYNKHRYGLTQRALKENGMLSDWKILSTNRDVNDLEFISSMEHLKYPIYGVQFHPEKNRFEFRRNANIPHSVEAVKISEYFSDFFVEETRKNNNSFPSSEIEEKALIYNYNQRFLGFDSKTIYQQIYLFNKEDKDAQLIH